MITKYKNNRNHIIKKIEKNRERKKKSYKPTTQFIEHSLNANVAEAKRSERKMT